MIEEDIEVVRKEVNRVSALLEGLIEHMGMEITGEYYYPRVERVKDKQK